jgi:hypothetical protein
MSIRERINNMLHTIFLKSWLLNIGFTEEQIQKYAKSKDFTLDELINDTNTQIDNIIRRQLSFELYESNSI